MAIKSDRWIRQQAIEHKMIAPFRRNRSAKASSPTDSPPTATTSASPTSSRSSPTSTPPSSTPRPSTSAPSSACRRPASSFRPTPSRSRVRSSTSRFPRDVLTICVGKSTYARCGIIVNVTPFEPEWEGFVTLEISNTTPLPARIYANEGLCQILFFQSDRGLRNQLRRSQGKVPEPARHRPSQAITYNEGNHTFTFKSLTW